MNKILENENIIQFEETIEKRKNIYTLLKNDVDFEETDGVWYLAQQECYDNNDKKIFSIEASIRYGEYYRFDIDSDYYSRKIISMPHTILDYVFLKNENKSYSQQGLNTSGSISILDYLKSKPKLLSQDGDVFEDSLYAAIQQYLEKNQELQKLIQNSKKY